MATEKRNTTSEEWEISLGEQFRLLRIQADLEQKELALKASVSLGALKNLENGKGSSLRTIIKITRALDRTDWLEALAPKVSVRPMQMLKGQATDSARKKVYRTRKSGTEE